MVCVGGSVVVSHALVSAPLFTAQAIRYLAAALLLLGAARLRGVRIVWPRGREWLWLAGIAATGLVIFNIALVQGTAHAEPAVLAVAVACVPIVLGTVSPLLEGGRPSRRVVTAALVVTAGACLVVGLGRTDLAGVGWAATVLAGEACFSLLAVPVLPRLSAWGVALHTVWIGALGFLILGLLTEGPGAAGRLTANQWLSMLYLAVMVTAVAFILWYSAVAALGAGIAGLLTGIAPISAALIGALSGAGLPRPSVWGGIALVVAGLGLGLGAGRGGGDRPRLVTGALRPDVDPALRGEAVDLG